MRRALVCCAIAGLPLLAPACTFYTACPTNQDPPPPNGGSGATGNNGGSGNNSGTGGDISIGGEAPMGEWVNQTFNLVDLESECGNVSLVSAKPDEDALIVSIAQHGLWQKSSGDEEWTPLGRGKESSWIVNRATMIVYDPEDSQRYWEAGIYNAGGVYRTDDGGENFIDLGTMHNDGVSVDFTDAKRNTLLVSGHETVHKLLKSEDAGKTWNEIGDKLPDEPGVCPNPLVLDASTYLLGCVSYGGGLKGIWRSSDGGDSWEQVSDVGGGTVPLVAADGSIYWVGEGNDGIVRSDDEGKTWTRAFGQGELSPANAVELPNGNIAALAKQRIVVSSDRGESWKIKTVDTEFSPSGIAYSAAGKAFYAWHWSCDKNVPKDGVMSYPFDFENE